MSEELKKGIPNGRVTGKKEFSAEEIAENDLALEKILKKNGILKENQTINSLKHP